jgi:hypothetical protein
MYGIGRRAFARILLLASGLVVAAACDGTPPPTAAPGTAQPGLSIVSGNYYVIRNVATNKVLDVESAGCCNGYWVHQWTYQGLANQQWRVVDVGGGYYKITARHSGRALDVQNASLSDGAVIHQWDYQGLEHQQWSLYNLGYDTYIITARHSGKSLKATGTSNGSGVRQYPYNGSYAEWRLEPI